MDRGTDHSRGFLNKVSKPQVALPGEAVKIGGMKQVIPLALGSLFLLSISSPGAEPERLTWAPPALENPITIEITNVNRSVKLDADHDYIIQMPQKITASGGVSINARGARNIVLIGGEIEVGDAGEYVNDSAFGNKRRALNIVGWKGTFHIEGLWIHGDDLAEGIDVDTRTPGAILQIQNMRVDNVHSRPEEIQMDWKCHHHPDIIQNWGGPTQYRIDRLTGYTDYQGFMLQPTQFSEEMVTELCDMRNMDLHASNQDNGGAYLIFWAGAPKSIKAFQFKNVWLEPRKDQERRGGAFPEKDAAWHDIDLGAPPDGNFVPEGVAGINYVSPGYENADKTAQK